MLTKSANEDFWAVLQQAEGIGEAEIHRRILEPRSSAVMAQADNTGLQRPVRMCRIYRMPGVYRFTGLLSRACTSAAAEEGLATPRSLQPLAMSFSHSLALHHPRIFAHTISTAARALSHDSVASLQSLEVSFLRPEKPTTPRNTPPSHVGRNGSPRPFNAAARRARRALWALPFRYPADAVERTR